MNTTLTKLNTLWMCLLFLLIGNSTILAQVNYTVSVTQVNWFEGGDCSEAFEEEYSALVWAFDDVNTAYQGGNCFTCDTNGNCTNNYNTQIASGNSTCAENITLRFSAWEDDRGGRCVLDTNGGIFENDDDCGCGPSNVTMIDFKNNGPGCTTYGNYGCSSNHNFRVEICWDYTSNSICSRATNILDGATAFNTTNTCAEGDQSSCANGGTGDTKALWYAYTASTTGTTVFETCGSGFDTSLSVFSDCSNTELACNDDSCGLQSSVSLNTTCGTTYYVRVAGYSSASGTGTLTITPPVPVAEAGPSNVELCLGGSSTMGGSPTASGTSGPYSYNWTPATYLSSSSAANPTFSATAIGTFTYNLQVMDVCGNISASDLVTVSVIDEDVDATTNYEICADTTVPSGQGLTVSCSGSCNTGTGIPSWYASSTGGTVLSTSAVFDPIAAGAVNNSVPGTYTFYVECACNDCISERVPVDFVVVAKPTIVLTPSDETCPGNNDGSITSFTSGGTAPYSLQWSTNSNNNDISNLAPGTYGVTVTDAKGCTVSNSATVNTGADTTPPICSVQNTSVQLDANGMASITVGQIDNNTSDDCDLVSTSLDNTDFTCANLGANVVTFTATDGTGNASTCTATVTVEDGSAPTCTTQDMTVQLDANGMASITAAAIDNGSSDNCAIANMTLDNTDFTCANLGANVVTFTATDGTGNASTCTATVTVEDGSAPICAAQDMTVQLDANGMASITAAAIDNGSSDNCAIANMALDNTDFTCANLGANVVTFTATDGTGNASTCTATVTVEDGSAPTCTTQDMTVQLDANGMASITAAAIDNGSSDNCAIANMTLDNTDFTCANLGANVVTFTATDGTGNASTCTATVTVEDGSAPICAAQDMTVQLDANGMASITAAAIDNGSSDNCAITNMALDNTDFTCANLGTNVVTFTATDGTGNASTCTATVTVEDGGAPICATQDMTVQLDANGMASITAAAIDNGSSDNCAIANMALDNTDFTCANLGANVVTFTATDGTGNASTCTATVTVEDGSAPICAAQDMTVQLDANGMASITAAAIDNGSSDNCAITNMALDNTDFTCANLGTNVVTFTATDGTGNASTCTATVTVEDGSAPICAAQDMTVQLDANGMASITAAAIDNGSSDNCAIANMTLDNTDFTCANLGANVVTFTATDGTGNASTCTATVTVEDGSAPICAAQDMTVQLDANGMASITAAAIDNGSSDNCAITNMALDNTDFTCANLGANVVTFTATDVAGNASTCTATVTVEDGSAPTCTTQDMTVQLDANGMASITAAAIDNGSSDNCAIANMTLDNTDFTCANLGTNVVTFTATDGAGNASTCTATVTVEDGSAPICATQDMTVQLDANGMASITAAAIDNGSSDNCGIANMTLDNTNFTCANLGTNVVTFTATDGAGNASTCTATVTVEDGSAPICATQDMTVQLDANGMASITAAAIDNGSSDNCGIANMTLDNTNFTCANLGTNVVTFTATDGTGNASTCTATVTVEDGGAPTCTTQDITVQLATDGTVTILPSQVDNGSIDPCGSSITSLDIDSFDCTDIGVNTVTLTTTDAGGNSSSCTATVTVEDGMTPIALTQDITVQLGSDGMVSITANQIDNGSSDNCTIANVALDIMNFTCANIGANVVTFTATDGAGNALTSTATVTVQDGTAPICTTQDITVQLDANGVASITAAAIDNGSSDNCGIAMLALDNTDFTCANIGANVVTFTATDGAGNVSTCTATVTVRDLIAPICMAQDITLQMAPDGTATLTPAQIDTGSSDNCGIQSITLSQTDFSCGDIGLNTVIMTITDMDNNNTSCTANVFVDPASCGACDDGIQNGQETGLDCGGPTCPVCPECTVSQYYTGAILSGIYQTSSTIGSSALIFSPSDVSLLAGTICLDPGFEVQLGAEFLANPVPCTAFADILNPTSLQTTIVTNTVTLEDGTIQFVYYLPTKGKVKMSIENLDGSFQQDFFDEEKLRGEHLVQITSNTLASGVYSLVFITEKGKRVERIVIP